MVYFIHNKYRGQVMKKLLIQIISIALVVCGCSPAIQEPIAIQTPETVSPTSQATIAPAPSQSPLLVDDSPLSLAGIYPGERIENIAEEYGLHYLSDEEANSSGINEKYYYLYSDRHYRNFYNGNGLAVRVFSDGTIGQVLLFASGYETPDGHQVGEDWPYGEGVEYSISKKYGSIPYTILYYSIANKIGLIQMDMFYDRILSDVQADLNQNGVDERFVLTGRTSTVFFEVLPRKRVLPGINGAELLYDDDPATRPRLTVYENEDIIWTQVLDYYHYHNPEQGFPFLKPKNQGRKDPYLELCYRTGGSGGDMYYKVLYNSLNNTYTIEFEGQR